MRTPEEVADDIHEELVVPSKTAGLIRERDREVRLALLDELTEYVTSQGISWWEGVEELRKQIEADNV